MDITTSRNESTLAALRTQRVAGYGHIAVTRSAGRTRIQRLYQEGAAKIRMPQPEGDWLEAVLINTAGGLTGGDRIAWQVDVGDGASAALTTQASEKIYRADAGHAEFSARIRVGPGARLAWLPQETIVFNRAAFARRLDFELGEGASLLMSEATVFGRAAMGERVVEGMFRDRWRIRQEGRLVHAEEFALGRGIADQLARAASLNGAAACATVLMIADDAETRLDAARTIIGDAGGASAWRVGPSGKLLARLYAGDGYDLRKRLVPLLALLNGPAGLPKTWSL